jgi:inhibitor of KinA sporulation pathway (predicted exonuclease)
MKTKLANVLDLELNGKEIIEIGITVVNLLTRQITKTVSIPIWPLKAPLLPEISELTGWTEKKLEKQGVPYSDACYRLWRDYGLSGRLTVVDSEYETDCFKTISSSWENVLSYMNIKGIDTDVMNVTSLFKIRSGCFENIGLERMLQYYGLEYEGKMHRADSDSKNIARLFLEVIK